MKNAGLFHSIFEAQVRRTPEAVAVVTDTRRLTYRELDGLANRAAHLARTAHRDATGQTITPDTLIGLCVERDLEAVVGILAILKAGGAWVALDPNYPAERLGFMLDDADLRVILSQDRVMCRLDVIGEGRRSVINLDETALLSALVADDRPVNINQSSDLAYVMYTSGSTGQPKGIMVNHSAMLSRFAWMWETFPFEPDDVCCAKASLNFGDSIWELLGGLLAGVPTAVTDDDVASDPSLLLSFLRQHAVTRLVVVPSLLAALLDELRRTGQTLPHLRLLTSSGELLPSALAREALEINDRLTLLNLYGSTEMSADATCCVVDRSKLTKTNVPLGFPIGRMTIHVLDEHLQPCPVGTVGELHVSGPGLARGYLNRPELTAEKFIDNPFAPSGGEEAKTYARLFRSGDLVRQRADGEYEFAGRTDSQIKLRGIRIELGEIEATITEFAGIRQCAVVAHETENGKLLAAYCVPSDLDVSDGDLRVFLAKRLPRFMVPSRFVALDALPMLPSGKLDRNALQLPEIETRDEHYVPPRTGDERLLARIWQDVLHIERVGVHENFYAIGGDSILSFYVASRAKQAGRNISPKDVFEAPTIADLARRCRKPSDVEADQGMSRGEVPLLPVQQYFFSWAKPNPHKFNSGFIARTMRPIEVGCLRRALSAVVRHHDALRLRFHRDRAGGWHQSFHSDDDVYVIPIHVLKLPSEGPDVRLDFIRTACQRLHDTLNIERGPLMCVGLFNGRNDGEHHFFLAMHQLVTDAISLEITLEDLRKAYIQLLREQDVVLPAKTTSYKQWAEKLIAYAKGPEAESQLDYWLSQGRNATPFPEDSDELGALQSEIKACVFELLEPAVVRMLRERLKGDFQSKLLHAIVTGLTLTAHRMSGQRDLVFHKLAHGREPFIKDADVSRTVGWFITDTPVTLRLPAGPLDTKGAMAAALDSVGRQHLAIPDNGIGHGALRHFSDDPRAADLADYDLVRTLFQYVGDIWERNYDGELFLPPDSSFMDLPDTVAAEDLADYHLHVYAYLFEDSLRLKLFYTTRNYRTATIERMGEILTDLVHDLIT